MENPHEIDQKPLEDIPDSFKHEELPEDPEKQGSSAEEDVIVAGEEIVEGDHGEADIQEVDGEEIIFTEEEQFNIEYDAVVNHNTEKNLLFDLYQPLETTNGHFLCKICMRTGKNTPYPDRTTFTAHRYKCHGSYNNTVTCPILECREAFASLYTLRRHLNQSHEYPLEIHQQSFENIGEFEKFRHLVEITSGCRYMMHTKQPKYRRQVMHCAKSEHKLVLQTQKHRLPLHRMQKPGSACPSVISYRVDPANGQVHTFMQLYHVGHDPDLDALQGSANSARPMDIIFPRRPACHSERPMQFVQIDVQEMPPAIYGTKVYEYFLVVTCLKTRFMWARPLLEHSRTSILRLLNTIFMEYGVPEGFSTTFSPTYVRDVMKSMEGIFTIPIREIWSEPPQYHVLVQWVLELAELELGTRNRWVEQLAAVIMEYNQSTVPGRATDTPFERMFSRKPPKLYADPNDPDETTARIQRFHYAMKQQEEAEGVGENTLNTTFSQGDKVFLRKGITKPRRGNNTQYYFGWIAERDDTNKYYPYKVHFSSTDSPWPSERNMYVWVSVYDLLPTTHKIREMPFEDRQEAIASILCTCSGAVSMKEYDMSAHGPLAAKASKCTLYRNILCSNQMSRHCCKNEGAEHCRFHTLYPEHDESYTKMEVALVTFCQQNKHRDEKIKDLGEPSEMRKIRSHHEDVDEEEEEDVEIEDIVVEEQEHGILNPEDVVVMGNPEQFHQEEYPKVAEKRRRPAKESTAPKRRKKTPSTSEDVPGPSEVVTTPSEEPSESAVTSGRRASGRRTIRPKNLDDYVE